MKKQKNNLKILGTVSPYTTKDNNCPGYLFNIDNQKILLDCGFGICKELKFPKDFENLNIFISHFHKDHYADIYAIAYASYIYNKLGILNKKINVYIPKTEPENIEYADSLLLKESKEHYFNIIEYDEKDIFKLDKIEITFMKNYHSINTYSTKIKVDDKTFVYTADVGPISKNTLVDFAKNANILIIESTFAKEDNQQNEFHLHAHEAAEIAKNASVKKLILTHFWPEHNKKIYLKEAQEIFQNVHIAKEKNTLML